MKIRTKLKELFEEYFLERGADQKDLKFLSELPLEVNLIRKI
jgi:hypothetical protein